MSTNKLKGSWSQRFFVILLSILLGALWFWLLGFVTDDIGSFPGPRFDTIESEYVSPDLIEQKKGLADTLETKKRQIKNLSQRQELLKDGTDNLQNTINQLLDIQTRRLERDMTLSEKETEALAESQRMFLENQKQYQFLNEQIADFAAEKRDLDSEMAVILEKIEVQHQEAQKQYNQLNKRHRMKMAAIKLAFLLPVFFICAWIFLKKRSGAFAPIIYALFIGVFVKVFIVVHEHFPSEYFKYIAIVVVIGIVLKLLFYLLKMAVSPKKDWLIRQYQENYDQNICPICNKPIRTGPLRYAARHRSKQHVTVQQASETSKYEAYICPTCGTPLYEECAQCKEVRHSLLPFCEHCGNEKQG